VGFRHIGLTFSQTPECFTEVVKGTAPKTFHQRSQENIMSIRINAKSIGNNDAKSDDLASAIRKAYAKAAPEGKAEIAADFKIGYIAGRERISLSDAQAIFEAGKGKGVTKANIAMIDRATSGFRYHIIGTKTAPAREPVKRMRVSTERRALAMDFLSNFKGDNLQEQIEEALALLNALK
jgi:hypothetical protein